MKPVPQKPNPLEELDKFRHVLIEWFVLNGKSYPWRLTTDPYAILVSELMLQQTQITTVLENGYFARWMARFPTVEALAHAAEQEVLHTWEGLGYYNRARNLQKTAHIITHQLNGKFPSTAAELIKLPGIGRYTAGALASFAFNQPAPIVDGNVARVLSRLFDFNQPIDEHQGQQKLWAWAEQLVDPKQPAKFNSALMELGQTHCRKTTPHCLLCPVNQFCQTSAPNKLPIKSRKATITQVEEHAILAINNQQILLAPSPNQRRKGLWHLPLRSQPAIAKLCKPAQPRPIYQAQYTITRFRVRFHLYQLHKPPRHIATEDETWQPLADLPQLPFAAPIRKALKSISLSG